MRAGRFLRSIVSLVCRVRMSTALSRKGVEMTQHPLLGCVAARLRPFIVAQTILLASCSPEPADPTENANASPVSIDTDQSSVVESGIRLNITVRYSDNSPKFIGERIFNESPREICLDSNFASTARFTIDNRPVPLAFEGRPISNCLKLGPQGSKSFDYEALHLVEMYNQLSGNEICYRTFWSVNSVTSPWEHSAQVCQNL